MNTDTSIVDQGIAVAAADEDAEQQAATKRRQEEASAVKKRLEEIDLARKFDKEVRRQYAIDRRYARGDSAFEVAVNLIGTYIDIMVAFLYARDPDASVRQARRVQPPKLRPPTPPQLPTAQQIQLTPEIQLQAIADLQKYIPQVEAYKAELERRRVAAEQRKRFCETLEIVISRMWYAGRLKQQALRWVRSALTVGIGWLKATWQERAGQDPIVVGQIGDLQDNIARVRALEDKLATEQGIDRDQTLYELEQKMKGLQANVEIIVSRGLALDLVAAEDITIAIGVPSLMQYLESPWVDHRMFKTVDEAKALFPKVADKIASATKYSQRAPKDTLLLQPDVGAEGVSAADADMFKQGTEGSPQEGNTIGNPDFVCIHETWSKDDNLIYTMIEGIDAYALDPYPPNVATTRFYPFFGLAYTDVDGERSPQSLTMRSRKLQDEYNRTRSNFAEHRRRSLPAILFDKKMLGVSGADAITRSVIAEFVGLEAVNPDVPLGNLFTPKPVSPIDGALYTVDPIRRDLEDIWGIQQALQGSTPTTNTATEASIQQAGFSARTDSKMDRQDDVLSDLAVYTAEIAFMKLEKADVQEIAGEDAVWPEEPRTVEDLGDLVEVRIRAGSSGKPDTTSDRQAWAQTLPILQTMVTTIGGMRGASQEDIADKLEQLARITLERSGDTLDIEELIPQGNGLTAEIDALMNPQAMPAAGNAAPTPDDIAATAA